MPKNYSDKADAQNTTDQACYRETTILRSAWRVRGMGGDGWLRRDRIRHRPGRVGRNENYFGSLFNPTSGVPLQKGATFVMRLPTHGEQARGLWLPGAAWGHFKSLGFFLTISLESSWALAICSGVIFLARKDLKSLADHWPLAAAMLYQA